MLDVNILEEALLTTRTRRDNYGSPLVNFLRIAILWSGYSDFKTIQTPYDVAMYMLLLKQAREINQSILDNMVDTAGYVDCIGVMAEDIGKIKDFSSYEESIDYLKTMSIFEMITLLQKLTDTTEDDKWHEQIKKMKL